MIKLCLDLLLKIRDQELKVWCLANNLREKWKILFVWIKIKRKFSVDFCSLTGSKQAINRRLTIDDSGDLIIHNTTFGDAGRFMWIVQNVRFSSGIIHNLRIECEFCS